MLGDSPRAYGPVSKALHWSMAFLFLWQFSGALLGVYAEDTALEQFFWRTHASIGFTLWLLVFVRGAWGLANLRNRPGHEGSRIEARLAGATHLAMYGLMLVVPSLAIARSIGSGRGLTVYGVQLVQRGGEQVPALTAPANALHGLLGWTLLVLIAGHVFMAVYHQTVRRDRTLSRMAPGLK